MTERLRIVVLGYLVRGPLGGLAWHHLQYVLGLARLGHEVWFVEEGDDYPSCYDPSRDATGTDPAYGLRFTADAFDRLGLEPRWAYHDAHTSSWHGPGGAVAEACARADLLLNVSGVNPVRAWAEGIPARVLVDTDPVFTQVRHLTDAAARESALAHTAFATFGECGVPDDGFPWVPTRQPVVLDAWPVEPGPADGAFTTVMQWESYPAVEHGGRRYGMKSDSFAAVRGLPRRTGERLELALGGGGAPRGELAAEGWHVREPLAPTRDPWTFQGYVRGSKGELSVAKHGYVAARCGWFSERSASYLASGRPVVVQETGFSDWLQAECGVVAFTDADEAVAGLEDVSARYPEHCAGARAVAEEYFDARDVLQRLIESAFAVPATAAARGSAP